MVSSNRKRQRAAFIVFAVIALVTVVAVLLSEPKVNDKTAQAEAYCKNEPGLPNTTGPEFQNCVEQYLQLR